MKLLTILLKRVGDFFFGGKMIYFPLGQNLFGGIKMVRFGVSEQTGLQKTLFGLQVRLRVFHSQLFTQERAKRLRNLQINLTLSIHLQI